MARTTIGRFARSVAAVGLALVSAACVASQAPSASTSADVITTTSQVPSDTSSVVATTSESDLSELPGSLVIENGAVVKVVEPDGTELHDLPGGVPGAQPTWAPDGTRVAWSTVSETEMARVSIAVPGAQPEHFDVAFLPFYYSWSPTGSHLGMLGNGNSGTIELDVLDVGSGEVTNMGVGAPFYFDWSPSGDALVAHVGATELRVIEIPSGEERESVPSTGRFQAPQWTDRGIFYQEAAPAALRARGIRLQNQSTQRLVVGNLTGDAVEIARFDGFGAFQSTNGRVAYLAPTLQPGRAGSDLWVATPGEDPRRINADPVFAFQWSPDGRQLLFLEAAPDNTGPPLRWSVWSDDGLTQFVRFTPTATFFRRYLPFWDQYDRSLSIWSPDGKAFVYSATDETGATEVFVQLIEEPAPSLVGPGEFASWSP